MKKVWQIVLIAVACGMFGANSARAGIMDGLVSYWPLDGDLLDAQDDNDGSNGNPRVAVGFEAGKFGDAGVFSGNNFVEITGGDESEFDFTGGDMSVSAWFTVDEFTGSWQALVAKGEGGGWRVARRGGDNVMSFAGGIGDIPGSAIGPDVTDGEWHNIVAISEHAVSSRLWVDGQLVAENVGGPGDPGADPPVPPSPNLEDRENRMQIGGNPDSAGRSWNGDIDDVGVWNRVLTPGEVAGIWNGGAGAPIPQAVPEPSTILLAAFGLLGLALHSLRRRLSA